VAFSANKRKSLSTIFLPPVSENPKVSKGYTGHDAFVVVGNRFVQRFPVYRSGDTNASPTGGTRELYYKLVPGEAGWVLKLDRAENLGARAFRRLQAQAAEVGAGGVDADGDGQDGRFPLAIVHDSTGAAGNSTRNVDPLPTTLSTVSVPPWAVTME
jgi:hypothetical protein